MLTHIFKFKHNGSTAIIAIENDKSEDETRLIIEQTIQSLKITDSTDDKSSFYHSFIRNGFDIGSVIRALTAENSDWSIKSSLDISDYIEF